MQRVRVVGAFERLHMEVDGECWCQSEHECECCGNLRHLDVEIRPDNRERMAVFSDIQKLLPPI